MLAMSFNSIKMCNVGMNLYAYSSLLYVGINWTVWFYGNHVCIFIVLFFF